MFGSYNFGTSFNVNRITIETYEDNGLYIYHRKSDPDIKKIISAPTAIMVHPVEPVTQPKEITHFLLIGLKKPILLSPRSTITYFVTFPVEIAIYASVNEQIEHIEHIDCFTLTHPKYTLYGTPTKGHICKGWKSDVYHTIPEVDAVREGVLKVTLHNVSNGWAELKKIVVDAYYMKIFYSEFASMNAVVTVLSKISAKTTFLDQPISTGMEKAVELFRLRKIPIVEKAEFTMRWGL